LAIQKFYLHDAATGNTGTLPSGTHSATTDAQSSTPTGKNTQRSMDGSHGTSQTSASWSTLANTSAQPTLLRMFESGPLAAQTIGAGNWQLSMAGVEANANANLRFTACVYVWRPGTGALVGSRIFDTTAASTGEPGTSETAVSDTTISGGSVTTQAGDILVCEIWRDATTQGTATARACQFFYDGTTDASASSNAAFLLAPASILEQSDPVNVLFDAAASSSITSNRNLAFNHTCGAAATKLYVAVIMGLTNDINQTVAVTYNSVSMTDIGPGQVHADSVSNGYVQVFELDNPATGSAKSVSIAITGGGTPGSLIGGAWSYSPASGFTLATGTPAHTSSTSPTTPITTNLTTTAGNRVAGAVGTGTSGEAALLTQVFLVNVNNSTAAGNGAAEDGYAPGGTTAVGFSVTDDAALIAWEIQAVSSGSSLTADATLAETTGFTATAVKGLSAAATLAETTGLTAAARLDANVAATLPVTAGLTAAAARAATAAATLAETTGLTAVAVRAATADGTLATTAGLTATAVKGRAADTTLPVTVGLAADATVTSSAGADATLPVTAGLTAAAVRAATADTTLAAVAGFTATAARAAAADTTLAVTAGFTATATVTSPAHADATLPVTAGFTATGVRAATATALLPMTAGMTAASVRAVTAAAVLPVTLTFAAALTQAGAITVASSDPSVGALATSVQTVSGHGPHAAVEPSATSEPSVSEEG
jgi:hypothetical protein